MRFLNARFIHRSFADPRLFDQMQQSILHPEIADLLCSHAGNKYNIMSREKLRLMESDCLPDQACRPVADNTVPDLFTHGDPEPVPVLSIAAHIHDEMPVHIGFSVLITIFKIRVFLQRFD